MNFQNISDGRSEKACTVSELSIRTKGKINMGKASGLRLCLFFYLIICYVRGIFFLMLLCPIKGIPGNTLYFSRFLVLMIIIIRRKDKIPSTDRHAELV